MKTLWCKNQDNPSDRISHAWAPLKGQCHEMDTVHYAVLFVTSTLHKCRTMIGSKTGCKSYCFHVKVHTLCLLLQEKKMTC
jgi:hypothetical protein